MLLLAFSNSMKFFAPVVVFAPLVPTLVPALVTGRIAMNKGVSTSWPGLLGIKRVTKKRWTSSAKYVGLKMAYS
jgi:hypothetical protein